MKRLALTFLCLISVSAFAEDEVIRSNCVGTVVRTDLSAGTPTKHASMINLDLTITNNKTIQVMDNDTGESFFGSITNNVATISDGELPDVMTLREIDAENEDSEQQFIEVNSTLHDDTGRANATFFGVLACERQ